jgi:hypothetical protein
MRGFDADHPTAWCTAFPDGIPDEVYYNELDHRQPVDGDHGIRFLVRAGDEYPQYALDIVQKQMRQTPTT